jgi:hypothetical protein
VGRASSLPLPRRLEARPTGQAEGLNRKRLDGLILMKWWLFSPGVDLAVFLGSAVLSLAALAAGAAFGLLDGSRRDFAWVPAVLLIDVAHVWATGFRTYLDPAELRRRPWLYTLVPVVGLVLGVALYSEGELLFWRALAYLAVFHFIRQQYGWVALYRARLGERDRLGRWLDTAAIYLATLYPLLYWHCHLPRRFNWFIDHDFTPLPEVIEQMAAPVYWAVLGIYAIRSLYQWLVRGRPNPGKDIVVATTATCWHVGIITFNSDYAFTVTNVVIHGVPYLALVYWYRYVRGPRSGRQAGEHPRRLATFLATVWLLAYVEEMLWDRGVWHERGWLFGGPWELGGLQTVLVPLLALPQVTHYVLDGFIWRHRSNPDFSLISPPASEPRFPAT